ncbi:MAG: YggT family protein [Spirochaetes bacterium]|nr:YggT family protein [Spirochaetota bacterium]
MQMIFGLLAAAVGIYSVLILIRIIISWFGSFASSKPVDLLCSITDPYLNWWQNKFSIRIGFLDFSAVLAIVSLSLIQNILYSLASYNRITIGYLLAILLMSLWSVFSFILGFCIIIIILRLIAYLTNRNIYSPFWQAIDAVSQPLLYRMNRIFYGKRIGSYLNGIIFSLALLTVVWIGGGYVFPKIARLLSSLPL